MSELYDDPRLTAMGLFAEAHRGLSTRFAVQLEEHGLSQVEFEVLMRLARSPGHELRMTDLAAQTSLSTSGVTRVVDRMERGRPAPPPRLPLRPPQLLRRGHPVGSHPAG